MNFMRPMETLATPRLSAESTALHYSNGSSDTQCERGSTMGDAIC